MEALRTALEERTAELAEARQELDRREKALAERRAQIKKTAALGAQLQGIQDLLGELGELDKMA